jgi:two-component system, NtrC family, nitrogen regulation sensor histidine kinase GlnL
MHYYGAMSEPIHDSVENLATPVAWLSASGALTGCNQAFASWLGVSVRRLLGMPLSELDVELGRLSEVLLRLPETEHTLRVHRARLAFPAGREHFAELWLTRLENNNVRVEVHPAEEFLGEDPAKALPAALSAALKGLAHEIRNPLAGMKGAAQLLSRRIKDQDSKELLELIHTETDRLTLLLERLLNPSPPREFSSTNIHAVLERVLQLADNDAGWAVRMVRDYDPSLPELEGDADRLTQAIWNLVRNALQSGASQVSLRTRAEYHVLIGDIPHRLSMRIEISDNGRGVPEDLGEQIFLPLVSGRAEGTGLGLALAQQVAREHGGSLGYRSRAGHTVFTLLLPITDVEDDDE